MNIFQKIMEKIQEFLGRAGVTTLSDADLISILEKEAEGTGLNWKTSVVDFLTLLKISPSRENRAALAKELSVPGETGTPAANEALRVAVFKKLASNGGNVPASLTD